MFILIYITVTSSTNLICFRRKYQESLKIAEYPLYQLIRLRLLEIHNALSTPNIDVRILAQCYCVAIINLSVFELDNEQAKDKMRKAYLIKQGNE